MTYDEMRAITTEMYELNMNSYAHDVEKLWLKFTKLKSEVVALREAAARPITVNINHNGEAEK